MAITRSQIARQLLAEGGAPRIPFRNGGGRTDANTMSGSGYGVGSSSSDDGYGGGDDVARPTYSQQLTALQDPMMQPGTTGETFPNIAKVTPKQVFGTSADNPMLYRSPLERALIQSIPIFGTAINLGEMNAFNMPAFRYSRTGGDTRFGDDEDTNGENEIIKRPLMPMVPKLPTDIEPEKSDYAEFTQRFTLPEAYRLADGGEVRQEYGLGDIVKKVTGAVKKVVKSDVGKAALLATAGAYAGGLGPFASTARFGDLAGAGFARDFLGKELFKDYFIKDVKEKADKGLDMKQYGGHGMNIALGLPWNFGMKPGEVAPFKGGQPITNLKQHIAQRGQPYWKQLEHATYEAGIPTLFDHYFATANVREPEDAYSDLPIKYASELGNLEKEEMLKGLKAKGLHGTVGFKKMLEAQGIDPQEVWDAGTKDREFDIFGKRRIGRTDGGRADYMGGGIAAIRRPNAIPPKSGPNPQGLPSMYNRVKRI